MNSFRLTFRNPATELEYTTLLARRELLKGDNTFLYASAANVAIGLCRCLVYSRSPWFALASALWGMCIALEIRCRRRMSIADLIGQRTKRVIRFRLLHLTFHSLVESLMGGVAPFSFVVPCIVNGVLTNFFMAASLRLKFEHHILWQLLSTFLMLSFAIRGPCAAYMNSKEPAVIGTLVDYANWASQRILMSTHRMFGPAKRDFVRSEPCVYLAVWLHAFLLLVVVSYVLWLIERTSRVAFVRTLPHDRRNVEQLDQLHNFLGIIVCQHVCLLVIGSAVSWRLNYFLVDVVESWGIWLRCLWGSQTRAGGPCYSSDHW